MLLFFKRNLHVGTQVYQCNGRLMQDSALCDISARPRPSQELWMISGG